jgi:hypothetical protein
MNLGVIYAMIKRPISELHFVKSGDPKPTVEIQAESLEKQGLILGQLTSSALSRFAAKNPEYIATIYLYGTMSVNFHEQGWSEFLIVAGSEKVLKALGGAFVGLPGVKSRYSDYIAPSQGIPFFHLEDGLLWEPEDAATWYATSPEDQSNGKAEGTELAGIDEESENDDDLWGDVVSEAELEADEHEEQNETPLVGRVPEEAARYRAARSDARVASIRQTIEQVFGLPEGSVALCGPDGRALRGDAFIRTLRRRWNDA